MRRAGGLFLILVFLTFPEANEEIEVIAHRGLSSKAPENTLPAIQKAIELGCDAVEVDLRATRDGIIILMHDATVRRTTNGNGRVEQLNYEQMRDLDAGRWFSEQFRGTRVPTLEEAIALVKGRARLYLDLKTRDFKAVTKVVRANNFSSSVYYRAYLPSDIRRIRGLDPEAKIVFDLDRLTSRLEVVESILDLHPGTILGSRLGNWTPETLQRARDSGTPVFLNLLGPEASPDRMRQAVDAAPEGILTDSPEALLRMLGRAY